MGPIGNDQKNVTPTNPPESLTMSGNTILLLGGYGSVGQRIARLLLKETQADLVIAGRRKALADEFAAEFIPLVADFKADICKNGFRRKATYKDAIMADMGKRFGII